MRRILIACCLLVACRSSDPTVVAVSNSEPAAVAPPSPPPKLQVPKIVSETSIQLAAGITLRKVTVDRDGVPMTLWIYRNGPKGTRPAVFIAPAGTPMVWGANLTEEDRPEQVPWAQRGYLVVAYTLDGAPPTDADRDAGSRAVAGFVAAHAGLDNWYAAVAFALADENADPKRLIAVGHSSAATMALWAGSQDARVAAIVAMAPGTSVLDSAQTANAEITSEQMDVLRASSPLTNVAALRARRVFLFHADDDQLVTTAQFNHLSTAMSGARDYKLATSVSGGHYESMLASGIPAAATWLASLGLAPP